MIVIGPNKLHRSNYWLLPVEKIFNDLGNHSNLFIGLTVLPLKKPIINRITCKMPY